jgi:heptaprenyl diphosphate synthase
MKEFWKDEPTVLHELEQVGSLLQHTVERSHPFVRDLLAAQLQSSGKMLRPALAMIGSRLGKPEKRMDALRIASVLEMIHIASLVHDDIIDEAKTRRGVPTIYAQRGAKQAVLAGDYLLSKAMALVSGKEGDLEPAAVSNAFSRLCQSELEQDAGQGNFLIPVATYLRRIGGKTASLFALSAYAGAAVTEAPRRAQQLMHRIGYTMGMAFQIQDDILDYEGNGHELGKEPGRDLLCGVPTLPLLSALEIERKLPESEQILVKLTSQKKLTKREAARGMERTIALGGVEKAKTASQQYIDRSFQDLAALGNPEVSSLLHGVFEKLTNRRT